MNDGAIMGRALAAARGSLANGEFPVGAALCIDDEVVEVSHNAIGSTRSLIAHAEALLLMNNGPALMSAWESGKRQTTIYTTLEPCLMCLSACAHSRVLRVVYACRDPLAGADHAPPPGTFYQKAWPRLEHDGALEKDSAELLLRYTERRPGWEPFREGLLGILETLP